MRSLFASVFVLVLAGCASGQTITQGGGSSLLDRDYKVNVRGATVGPITIANDLNSGDSLDGLTLANGDRILVKDQSTASQNGIYVVGASPARSSDANSWAELNGAIVAVAAGTANAGNVYVIKTAESGTLGSTNITVEEKGATGAGTGDLLASNNLSDVANATTSRTNLGLGSIATQDSSNVSITGGSLDGIAITGASYDGQINATATFETPATSRTALGLGASDTPTFAGLAGTSLTLGGGASALGLRFLEPSGGGTSYFSLSAPALAGNVTLTLPIDAPGAGEVLGDSNADGALEWITPAGTGDVTAASSFGTDNRIIRSDGTGKGVQHTGWSVADDNKMSISVSLAGDSLISATNTHANGTGIYGASSSGGYGVYGSTATLIGVYGVATGAAGIGVVAQADDAAGIPLQLKNSSGFQQSHTFAGTANRIIDWPDLAGVPALSASALTSGRVPYATTGGALTDEAALAYNAGTNTLTVENISSSGTLTIGTLNATTLNATTFSPTTIELGHASDTTMARVGAGQVSIEGVNVVTTSSTDTLTNKTLTSPTLTTPSAFTTGGTITLAENTSIALDPSLSADGKYSGTTMAGTAGATLAFGDIVYLAAADSRWELVDADSATTSGNVLVGAVVLAAASDGDPTVILLSGNIRADTAFPSFTISAPVYISATAGDATGTAPSTTGQIVRRLGFALTADSIYFNPSMDSGTAP